MAVAVDKVELAKVIVEDRWDQATSRPRRYADEPVLGTDNSEVLYRIRDGIEELGARLIHRSDFPHDDDHGLDDVINDLEGHIHDALVSWAGGIEAARLAR